MRIIAHLDMDAFFAAVEEGRRPYLKGQPIAVGADPKGGMGRGVVSTANYAARVYGLHSAMPIREAWRLSEAARKHGKPAVVFITPEFGTYGDTSRRIMAIVAKHLAPVAVSLFESRPPAMEQVSLDECFFDLSFSGLFKRAEEIAKRIKKEIFRAERMTASVGIGPNKLVAKVASDFRKPDGLTVVPEEKVMEFLRSLSVRKIPGVGPKAELTLKREGITTVAQGQKVSEEKLRELFGKWGSDLHRKFRGEDESEIETVAPPAKSVGEQETLPVDSLDMDTLILYLEREARDVMRRFKADGFKTFRTIVLTVRFADFTTRSRSRTLPEPLSEEKKLVQHATQMFFPFLDRRENPKHKKIRLIGVRVEKLL